MQIAVIILAFLCAYLLRKTFKQAFVIVEYIKQFGELDTWNTNAQVALQAMLDEGVYTTEEIGRILGMLQGEELADGTDGN